MKQPNNRKHRDLVLGLMILTVPLNVPANTEQDQTVSQSAVFSDGLQSAPRWQPHIDAEAKPGSRRDLGEIGLFLPVVQDPRRMLFADLRSRFDGDGGVEGNFGLGYRQMLDSGWNLGAYGYFDRRRTARYDNYFNQLTLGVEALSLNWDLRANRYVPIGERRRDVDGMDTASIEGTSVVLRRGQERSLSGYDAEVGWRIPVSAADDNFQMRVFAGGYRFSASGVDTVSGPRGRLEAVFSEVPGLWRGSRLSLGLEVQRDSPRGSQTFASFRIRIPLGDVPQPIARHRGMAQRMTDPIVRDVDVVTQVGNFGREQITNTMSGQPLVVLDSGSTSDLPAAVAAAGANSTVILTGSFNTGTTMTTLQPGQTLMGAGTMKVRSPSGRTATLTTPGATINAATVTMANSAITMANDSTLRGVTITNNSDATGNPRVGVYVTSTDNVTIANNTISVFGRNNGAQAILVQGTSSGVLIENNTLTANGTGATVVALNVVNTSSVTIRNNTLSATGSAGNSLYLRFASTTAVTVGEGSTGNIAKAGTCQIFLGAVNGSVQFNNAPNCP